MPLWDYECRDCGLSESDAYYPLERDAPRSKPCTCGGAKVRLIGSQALHTPKVLQRTLVPGEVIFRGTPLEEAARNGETVNPDLPKDHPGHYSNETGRRVYVDQRS